MLSAVVITKNEEERIKACLESVKWADEIIVYDNGSTDKTLEIAEKYTGKIFKFNGQDYAQLRNKAMEKASGDWVLYVDADERVLESLKEEIIQLIKNDNFSAFAISRQNIIFGQMVDYGPYKNDWMIRLLKKSQFKTWVGKIHEHAEFTGNLGYCQEKLLHLTHRDIDQIVLKSLYWSEFDAKLRFDSRHPKMSGWRFLRILLSETYHQGITRRGFFNGTVGVMDSLLQVFSLLISYIRLWQFQQPKPLTRVYDDIDQKLIEEGFHWK